MKIVVISILFFYYQICNLYAQDTPYKAINYSFIRQNADSIYFFGKSTTDFYNICSNLSQMITKGNGQLRVLQIGDSHIQADHFSGRLRENLQSFALGIQGSRGFIFPYNVAATNNPDNYKVKYTGKWQHCRNIQNLNNCELGIAGISVTTSDSSSSIQIILNNKNYPHQDFNKVKIFHNTGDSVYQVKLNENQMINGKSNTLGFTTFTTTAHFDTLNLFLQKTDSLQHNFTLYGIELDNDDPGVIFSAVGVNGAEINSFLKCSLLESQLKILNPDWIIISLGTNDAYGKNFDGLIFENNYNQLIKRIKNALPKSFILLTTPADSYRKKRYPNPDMTIAKNIILNIAKQNNCAAWDLYEIMGGFKSMKLWQNAGLSASDKVHCSKAGYVLQGDLLFNAILKAYDKYIESGNRQ